jgi:acyl-homoserine lactone acylase PvdQ
MSWLARYGTIRRGGIRLAPRIAAGGYPPAVALDISDWDASLGSLPGGQSENPTSPHYNDLLGIWAKGGYHPLPFFEAAVEAATVAILRLAPKPAEVRSFLRV